MKLEVGKSYRRRDGSGPVKIIRNDGSSLPFESDDGSWYYENGNYNHDAANKSPDDLIAEWEEPETEPAKNAKPDWYWGFWEWVFKHYIETDIGAKSHSALDRAADFADAACAERMKREV